MHLTIKLERLNTRLLLFDLTIDLDGIIYFAAVRVNPIPTYVTTYVIINQEIILNDYHLCMSD